MKDSTKLNIWDFESMNFFNQSETTNPNWPKIIIMVNFVRGYVTVKTLSNLDG